MDPHPRPYTYNTFRVHLSRVVGRSGDIWLAISILACSLLIRSSAEVVDATKAHGVPPNDTHHELIFKRHDEIQACQSAKYGNVTHSRHRASSSMVPVLPLAETRYMLREVSKDSQHSRPIYVFHQVVNNPLTTWSVLEPGHSGSCQVGAGKRISVEETARQGECLVAVNAGFFDAYTGQCLGHVVSDGYLIEDPGEIQNVHFGVTSDGHIFTGYLSEEDLRVQKFTQLVGGLVWLVRDGENYVDESSMLEGPYNREIGTMDQFVSMATGRTAVGHDGQGRIHMVQINGRTDMRMGVNLHEFAELLIELGLVNAINLDGGGSATTVINGTLVNYPSDKCVDDIGYNCPREVSTVFCVRHPLCSPRDCSGHGSCVLGVCQCQGHWAGPACDRLECPDDCSWHGECTQAGCQCHPGWMGDNCSMSCPQGWHGPNCSTPCVCENGATCHPGTGHSSKHCGDLCMCEGSCFSDHVIRNLSQTSLITHFTKAGQCPTSQENQLQIHVPQTHSQHRHCSPCEVNVTYVDLIAFTSLLLNIVLIFLLVRTRNSQRKIVAREEQLAAELSLIKMMWDIPCNNNKKHDTHKTICVPHSE